MTCEETVKDKQDDKYFDALKLEYEMVCKSHDGIADFRAKLLALLPIASGAGIFLLLKNLSSSGQQHLTIIGIFGIFITIGLFLYELKNIQKCNYLIDCGEILEYKLFCPLHTVGTFTGGKIPRTVKSVSTTWAGLIIYSTVIGGWTYLSLIGIWKLIETNSSKSWVCSFNPYVIPFAFILAAGVAVLTIFVGRRIDKKYECVLKRHREGLEKDFIQIDRKDVKKYVK